MRALGRCGTSVPRPRHEVGDIARRWGGALRERLPREQRRALAALSACRTAQLGGHLDRCGACGFERPSYNSCRDRHCPKCQALAAHRWLEARRARLLPTHYFHVVFTLPAELRALVKWNPRALLALLFRAATSALIELGRDRLGAELGATAVLHTWSRDLSWHPHLHCVVTGGGLDPDGQWKATRPRFLLPVRALGRLFRGKFLAGLARLRADGALRLPSSADKVGDAERFERLLTRLYARDWVVYSKRPFGGADAVFRYLGRYTHRIGLSNARLLHVDEARVVFRTREEKRASLPPAVFLARFLQHVLPPGFVRIRHYGLLASANVRTKLEIARNALAREGRDAGNAGSDEGATDESAHLDAEVSAGDADAPLVALLRRLAGVDLRVCPECDAPAMHLGAEALPRGPP